MKPGIPWSVKGIGTEAREAAKVAARRSGMTLGEWLNTVILESSESPALGYDDRPAARPYPRQDSPIRLEDLAQQLARLTSREQETAPARVYDAPPPRPALDDETLGRITQRMETSERQTIEAFSAINERLAALGAKIAEGSKARYPERPEDVPGYQALEGALRNVVGHIETSEKRTRDALKGLQDRMAEMAGRAATAESERVLHNAPVINKLETRLAELAQRLERTETTAQRDLPSQFAAQIADMSRRMEEMRVGFDTSSQRVESAAVRAAQQELRDIEGRIQKLFTDAQSTMRGSAMAAQDFQRARAEIESLNQRLDDLRAEAASERDLGTLRIAIEQLSTRVAQGPDLRPLQDMDRRLADITQHLAQSDSSRLEPQMAELGRRVHELDQRLAMALQRDDSQALHALEQQIGLVADRLGQTEQHIGHLSRLEGSIAQLYESVEQSRNWTRDVAEDAANRMAERLLQDQHNMLGSLPQQGPSPELRALEEGLSAVRAAAAQSDQRNQETLEAVHETLEQIVNKLAEMEEARAAVQPAPPPPPVWTQPPAAEPELTPAAFSVPPAFQPEPRFEAPRFEPAPPPPHMPDVGLAPPVMPEPQLAPAPSVISDPSNVAAREDFIAAARRAAQAAASQTAASSPAAKAGKSAGFSIPFLNRKKAAAPVSAAPRPVVQSNKRTTYIVAGVMLLVAVSALAYRSLLGGADAPVPQQAPPTIEEKATPQSEAPDGAVPPKPRPAELESGMPAPDTLSAPEEGQKTGMGTITDSILTGTLPSKAESSLAALISGTESVKSTAGEMPPPEAGPEELRHAAAEGNAAAQFIVASNYLDGKKVEQDFTQAAKWYQKAAAQGLAPAQYRIATLFERGRGVPQDVSAARVWYERAAEQGNVKAMHNAAVIFSSALEGKPDYAKAAKWFGAAAEHGLKDSQYNYAVLLERGLGVKQNAGEALFWYSLAARQNDADAAKKVMLLEQSLAPSTVGEAKGKVESWTARQGDPAANIVAVEDPAWSADATPKTAAIDALTTQSIGDIEVPESKPVVGEAYQIQRTQALLNELGYDVGAADGKMGARTANAIRLFELQSGMKVTGKVSEPLIAKLLAKKG